MNSIRSSTYPLGLNHGHPAGDFVLDVVGTVVIKVSPGGIPLSQSFYALRNGVTGEQRVVKRVKT